MTERPKSERDSYINEKDDLVFESTGTEPENSGSVIRSPQVDVTVEKISASPELTGVAVRLATIELPKLPKENRARLQIQTPNRLYFYWSLKHNPYTLLNKTVGGAGGYQLVLKLVNLTHDLEEIHAAEASGDHWFTVDSNCDYRCELGLYAPNRPYIRILYSNTVTTPRKRPSPRVASDRDWIVTSEAFAGVLKVSGFEQDAFAVAIGSGGPTEARDAFEELIGTGTEATLDPDELKYALLYLSLGLPLDSLRWRIDASLFRILQQYLAKLNAEAVRAMLKERFGIETDEMIEEEPSSAVYDLSGMSFPRRLRRRSNPDFDYLPVSSFSS